MRQVDRRKFVSGIGTAVIAGVAGCSGGNGGSGSGNGDTDAGGSTETEASTPTQQGEQTPEWQAKYQSNPEEIYGQPVRKTPEEDTIDPDPLVFAYVPDVTPAVYQENFQPLIDRLEDNLDRSVEFFAPQSYAAEVEAMRSGRLHIGGFSTGTLCFAVNLGGAQPFASSATADGEIGYRMFLITQPDSDIENPEDLEGKTVAHTEPASNSGNQAPRAIFSQQFDVVPEEDYEVIYSGGHDKSVLGVANGDYDAAPISSIVLERMRKKDRVSGNDVEVVWESRQFPATGLASYYKLNSDLQQNIRDTIVGWNFEGTALGEYFSANNYTKFISIDYKKDWGVIRQIQKYNGIEYTTEGLSE